MPLHWNLRSLCFYAAAWLSLGMAHAAGPIGPTGPTGPLGPQGPIGAAGREGAAPAAPPSPAAPLAPSVAAPARPRVPAAPQHPTAAPAARTPEGGNHIEVSGNQASGRVCGAGGVSVNSVDVQGAQLHGKTVIVQGRNSQNIDTRDCPPPAPGQAPASQASQASQVNQIRVR